MEQPRRSSSGMKRLTRLLLSLLGLWLWTACAGHRETPQAFPTGPAFVDPISFEFALFYPQPPREEPQAALEALLASDFSGLTQVEEVREKEIGESRVLTPLWVTDARQTYAAPDTESLLRYSGRGLDNAQAQGLQRTDSVLRLVFGHGQQHAWTGMQDALRLTSALARRTGGLIWDEETREMFTPDFWDEHRIATWTETVGPPDLRTHFTIHAYRSDDRYQRAISLGLVKFGLPDIVIEQFSGSTSKSMGNLINLLAQALAEGAAVGANGELALDIRSFRTASVRDRHLGSLAANATGTARLRLVQGTWEEGDPQNRLVEISFDRYAGPDLQARQQELLATLYGAEPDAVAKVDHDAEILAASQRARERLLALKPAVQAGLQPGEILLVKAPFQAEAGREWMWVEVIEWKGSRIFGTLQSEPVYVKDLRAGQRVDIAEEEVFDYIRKLPDGSEEGNETAKYLHPEG